MKFEIQAFPQYLFESVYDDEERFFKKTVNETRIRDLPSDENTINSHVKNNVHDNMSLKLKARIELYGNKDSIRNKLQFDCSRWHAPEIRTIRSVASLYRWRISKTSATLASLQTDSAARNVYVLPPKKCQVAETTHGNFYL